MRRQQINWFKHDTDSHESEGISYLIEKMGMEGVGMWYFVLEIIASKMDKSDRCHAEFPISKWCSLLKVKQNKLNSFLKLTEFKLKTKVTRSDNLIRIEVPNLLKKKNEYAEKSRHTSGATPPKNKDEREKSKEKELESPQSPPLPEHGTVSTSVKQALQELRAGGNGKYSETPQELADEILKYLDIPERSERWLAERNTLLKKITLDGLDFIRFKFISMKEREDDPKSPVINNRVAYFFQTTNTRN